MEANDYKTLGNTCFVNKEYAKAIEFYSKGLRICKKEDSINLFANRAVCYIKLDCFQKALNDTIAVLEQDPLHEKGIFRHVKCLWGLGRYESALTFINSKLAKNPQLFSSKELLDLRRNTETCFHQSKTGQYDILELMKHQQERPLEPLENVAEYVGPIKIRDVPGKGRGILAEEDIKTGQLIMCCKPFAFYPYSDEELGSRSNFALVDCILEKLSIEPQFRKEVFPLHTPLPPNLCLDMSQEDLELAQLHAIIANNSFEFNGSGGLLHSNHTYFWSGLWILPSYINHSCSGSNCTWSVYGDTFFVRAVRPIIKGDEILISYVNITWPYKHRLSVIRDHKFECDCDLCEYERGEDEDTVEEREQIFDQLEEIYDMDGLMPKQTIIDCFNKLDSLRVDSPHLNFPLANVKVIRVLQRFLVERDTTASTTQVRIMFERIHSVTKNTAHAKFVVSLCLNVLNCFMEDATSETGTIQGWIKQLKDDLIAAHGSPKALLYVGPDMLELLKDMLHANDFL